MNIVGYGETKPYWYKFLVGVAWGLPSLLIGFSIWVLLLPFLWIILFYASNDDALESQFTWNVCELLVGVLIGVTYVQALKGAW